MESGSFTCSILVNALSGTAWDGLELVVALAFAVELLLAAAVLVAPMPDAMAFVGGLSVDEDGVKAAAVVVAFDPADEDPEAAKDDDAPGPEVPEDAPDWM